MEKENLVIEEEYKECPYCAETIKARAIVCRYCKKEIETPNEMTSVEKKDDNLGSISLVLGLIPIGVVLISLVIVIAMLLLVEDEALNFITIFYSGGTCLCGIFSALPLGLTGIVLGILAIRNGSKKGKFGIILGIVNLLMVIVLFIIPMFD